MGAGIGVTIHLAGSLLLTASIPVSGHDATRVEALGPLLIALLLSQFPRGSLYLYGDSKFVCN